MGHDIDCYFLKCFAILQVPKMELRLFQWSFGPVAELARGIFLFLQHNTSVALILPIQIFNLKFVALTSLVLTYIAPITIHNLVIFFTVKHVAYLTLTGVHWYVSIFDQEWFVLLWDWVIKLEYIFFN